ncbi:hypothetical protein Rhe02_50530 [Rhizocola hellebori]|uniref:YncI copper-binding domain-containing protein n=1 Tax=Rhizocola hellebori TaxID=1392758 RepID=A0A8J3VIE8_9ACTN|nr:YcnI family protein [Rhizocola hellebori]GIH06986.1 hypothetical protein Rhe02_50530 [Rhizocola hellebori]
MKKVATILLAAIGVLAIATPAAAHVTVNPGQATQGSYARLAFRVPTESDTASTTKLEVQMPENAALESVSTQPVPGWTIAVTKNGDKVSVITWTASAGAAIKPGEFQEFAISAGPMPTGVDQVLFKALQTYSDGTVVRWIDPPKEGAEHPAPALNLVPAASPSSVPLADNNTGTNNGLAWAGLGVGIVALILAGLALVRSRRS